MSIRAERRAAAIECMADFLLSEGLSAATLRPLALAAGTSDRMLLYYFVDRDEILTVTLERVMERLLAELDRAVPAGSPRSFNVLLEEICVLMDTDTIKPYRRLWLELVAGAAREFHPHLRISGQIADGLIAWISSRLKVDAHSDHATSAALLLSIVEGAHVLKAVNRSSLVDLVVAQVVSKIP